MSRQLQMQVFFAAVLLLLALCILAGYRVYNVMTTPPDSDPAVLEAKVNAYMARFDRPMEASLLLTEQMDDQLYASFTDASHEDQLVFAIFKRDLISGWRVCQVDTGSARSVAWTKEDEPYRLLLFGTGGEQEGIARCELWADDSVPERVIETVGEPFLLIADDPNRNHCPYFYNAAGEDISESVWRIVQLDECYGSTQDTVWTTLNFDLFGFKIQREVTA